MSYRVNSLKGIIYRVRKASIMNDSIGLLLRILGFQSMAHVIAGFEKIWVQRDKLNLGAQASICIRKKNGMPVDDQFAG